jgi:hypothetical protein
MCPLTLQLYRFIHMSLVQLSTLLPFSNGKLSKAGYMEFHDKLIAILQPKAAAEQVESIQEV